MKCSDGTAYEGDIVIGADGVRSKTRRIMRNHMLDEGLSEQLRLDTHSRFLYYRGQWAWI